MQIKPILNDLIKSKYEFVDDSSSEDEEMKDPETKPTSSSSRVGGLFQGLSFLLICGKHMSTSQANIHCNNIRKRDGRTQVYDKDKATLGDYDMVISGNDHFEKIEQMIKPNCTVVTPKWVTDCIQNNTVIKNFKKYEIRKNQGSQSTQSSQNSQFTQLSEASSSLPATSNENVTALSKEAKKEYFQNKFLNSFICVNTQQNQSECPNKELADMIDQLHKHYNGLNETFRALAYRKAATVIKGLKFKITSIDQIKDIPNIGEKVREKIKEYLKFGKISRLESIQHNDTNNTIQQFLKIWGVGSKTAESLYAQGYRRVEDIDPSILNSQQLVGLKYFNEFQVRIPREEVERISKVVQKVAREFCSDVICETCGSYRRGKKDSGDVDVLISVKQGENDAYSSSVESDDNATRGDGGLDGLLQNIVSRLEQLKIVTDTLSLSCRLHIEKDENDTFMGVYCFDDVGIHRRLDIKVYRREHYAPALLYFTGSDHFNRSMRLLCRKKGYALSDKYLYINTIRDKKSNRIHDGQKVFCSTEREIFDKIGIPYKEPTERDA